MSQNIQQLRGLQRECVVLIFRGHSVVGTGFLIAPGLILTCAHVAGPVLHRRLDVIWQGKSLPAGTTAVAPQDLDGTQWPYPDLAVVKLGEPVPEHPSLWLDDRRPHSGAQLIVAGYPSASGPSADARSVTVTCLGDADDGKSFRVSEDALTPEMSGAPVLNPVTGGVCGVIRTEQGLVTPTRGLRGLEPATYRGIRHEHDRHHAGHSSSGVRAETEPSPRHLTPSEERGLRATLATITYDRKLVRDNQHDYGDAVIDLDEGPSGQEPIPPAIGYVIQLVRDKPKHTALRYWLLTTADRMGIGEQVRDAIEPPVKGPDPPLGKRPDDPSPGGTRREWRPFVVTVVAAVLALGVLAAILWIPQDEFAGCAHPTEVRVLTSPEQLGSYRQVADAFERWTASEHDGCRAVNVYVYAAQADKAREALVNGWSSDPEDDTRYLRDVGPQADVWLPGSQLELAAVADRLPGAGDSELIGSTPLVMGIPRSRNPERDPSSWLTAMNSAVTSGLGVVRPDPSSSVAGALATVALYSERGLAGSVPRELEGWFERSLDEGDYPIGDSEGLLCRHRQPAGSGPPEAVITTEQALAHYNSGAPLGARCAGDDPAADPLLATYPADTVSVGLHVVPLSWSSDAQSQTTREAAAEFSRWLSDAEGKEALLDVGVRAAGAGSDLGPLLSDDNGVLPDPPIGDPVSEISADARETAFETYTRARRPGRVLLAVDASGSMGEPIDNRGSTRFDVAKNGVIASLAHMDERRDELGLWLFSTRAGPGVSKVLPIGRGPARARELVSGAEWRPNGNTPLYRAMTDGMRTLGTRDDEAINALVVLTDGEDTASGDWLDDLRGEIGTHPNVRIFLIATGEANCDIPVFEQLVEDTAGQCLPATASTIDDTLTTLFQILWTKG